MVHRQSKAVEVYFYNVLKTERMGKYDEQNYYVTCGQFIFPHFADRCHTGHNPWGTPGDQRAQV